MHVSAYAHGVREELVGLLPPCEWGSTSSTSLGWWKHLHLLSISQASGRFSNLCVGTGGKPVREKWKKKSLLQISDVTLAFRVGGSWWSLKVIPKVLHDRQKAVRPDTEVGKC